jgi:transposase
MWHVGIDLHRATVVMAAVSDTGEAMRPITIACQHTAAIVDAAKKLTPFRAVIEASGTYRWLYDLLRPYGVILLAHPLRLRAMIQLGMNSWRDWITSAVNWRLWIST